MYLERTLEAKNYEAAVENWFPFHATLSRIVIIINIVLVFLISIRDEVTFPVGLQESLAAEAEAQRQQQAKVRKHHYFCYFVIFAKINSSAGLTSTV